MRLLLKKEVDKGKQSEEDRRRERLVSVNEELQRKESILNRVTDGMPAEKERILKEFDRFREDVSQKRTRLDGEITVLNQRKTVLEIETIRKDASQAVLEKLEDTLIRKKRALEENVEKTKGELKQEKEVLGKLREEQMQQQTVMSERSVTVSKEERQLENKKQDLKEKKDLFEQQKKEEEIMMHEEKDKLKERKSQVVNEKAANDAMKELIFKEWEDIERTKLKLKDERAILDSAWSELKSKQNA